MHVWLQVSGGQAIGQKFHLRRGQLARFGNSNWADFSFPDDPAMEEIQFEVRVDQAGPRLRHNGKQTETLVNGTAVKEQLLASGDVVIAGETTFSVYIEGEAIAAAPAAGTAAVAAPTDPYHTPTDMQAVAQFLELDEEPLTYAKEQQTPRELVVALQQAGEYASATRVRAWYLPKPLAVAWGVACLEASAGKSLSPQNVQVLAAVSKWAKQPTDAYRLAAGRMAEAAFYDGPAAMLALAVFCSEGNIGHPDHEPVVADVRITSKCVATALLQAAYWGDPTKSAQRFKAFLAHELLPE